MSSSEHGEDDPVEHYKDPVVQCMQSIFKQPDVILVVGGEELYVGKSELMEKSPVFNAMFSSPFKEKDARKIELPGKNVKDFLTFLRCLLSGMNDEINMSNVYTVVPLAHEYQVDLLLTRAQLILKSHYGNVGYTVKKSQDIVNDIIFAENYDLSLFLDTLIDFASKKWLRYFSEAIGFEKISHTVLHKIAMKRWEDNLHPQNGERYSNTAPEIAK